jgi:hypothetical protein
VKGVANERLFYQLNDLTPEEVDLIEHALIEPCSERLRALHRDSLRLYTFAPKLKKHAKSVSSDPTLMSVLEDMIDNDAERHHCRIESLLEPFVSSMLAGDTSFYSDDKEAAKFLYAICLQFTRTKRAKQAAILRIGTKYKGCDARRVWDVIGFLLATSVGQSLYVDRKQFKLLLLDNNTDEPFITGDQPIINLHATPICDIPEKLEYYYPLSPRKAMLLLEVSNQTHASVSAIAVNRYNILIAEHSYQQLYSNSEEYLVTLRKLLASQI